MSNPAKAIDLMAALNDSLREAAGGKLFAVGQVWVSRTNPEHRWRVDEMRPGGKAVLRSVSSPWATTNPLTVAEFNDRNQWAVEARR